MTKQAWEGTGASGLRAHDLQLVLETLSWLAAWLIFPVWLASRHIGGLDFLLFSLGAGLLLSVGVAADRPRAFRQPGDMVWFAAISSLAVTVFGGSVFVLTSMILALVF